MLCAGLAIALLSGCILAPFLAVHSPGKCDIGPITKVFGSVPWLLYSCDDRKSLMVVSAPGSPAAPFYFFFSPQSDGYHLSGEGTGSKSLTDAAHKELEGLGNEDIADLISQTSAIRNGAPKR
jgi:hypothetical protein